MLAPGSTIGILGGGQLGRMLAVAAVQLGYRVAGYAPPGENVAVEVGARPAMNQSESRRSRVAHVCDADDVLMLHIELPPPQRPDRGSTD